MLSYEKLDHAVNNCPDTWTAALFLSLLKRVIEIPVFNDIESVVATAKERILKDKEEASAQHTTQAKGLEDSSQICPECNSTGCDESDFLVPMPLCGKCGGTGKLPLA